MGKALYRKYRPTALKDVVGQESVVKALESSLKSGQISHAYLFIGPRGTGKTSIARIFAHAINDFEYQLEDDYIDIIEIDAASNTGVDNIRELREKTAIAPTKGKYKIYIIDEIHMLSKSAFNALLKTLEEPPAHVVFIMATTDPQKIPATITSRAQVYTFNLAPPEVMKQHLAKIAKSEKLKIDDAALDIIVRRGGGSFRDSISLLDQLSALSGGAKITGAEVEKALGLPQDEKIANLLAAYANADIDKITTLLKDLLSSGSRPETIAEEALSRIVANPQPELLPLLARLPEVKAPFPEAKLLVAFLAVESSVGGNEAHTHTLGLAAISPAKKKMYIPDVTDGFASQEAVPPANQRMTFSDETGAAKPSARAGAGHFSWDTFLQAVQSRSTLLFNFLKNAKHHHSGSTLDIYIKNQGIINSPNNKALLSELAGCPITTHDLTEYSVQNPGSAPSTFSQISDIMGNVEEVNDAGEQPFN